MKIEFNRPTIYVSHPIRGTTGKIKDNCEKVERAVHRLRKLFPEVDWYVPAEHDLTLQILTAADKLSIDDVMFADLQILNACHGWFFYQFDDSNGSEIEAEQAVLIGLISPGTNYRIRYSIEKANNNILRKDFTPIVEEAVERFRNVSAYRM
jgi:hypothetical protein